MSEDRRVEDRQGEGALEGGEGGEGDTEPSMLLQKLKSNISKSVQTKVDQILQDVQRFSDNDKLYLYLQLPSGPSSGEKSSGGVGGGDSGSFNTADQLHTCNWIRSHLEAELTELVQTYKQEVTEAACELICDWAQKILKRSFDTVVEIARYLIQEHIVNPRCSQAELVAAAALAGGPAKTHKVIKKAPVSSKAESDGDHKKELGDSSSSSSLKSASGDISAAAAKPSSLEAPPSSSSSSLRPAVEAFMKQLPRILPRSSIPDKTQLSVRSSPPSLAPKDAPGLGSLAPGPGGGGGVKVIAMAALPQQQGGPVPVMILPQGCLSYEREKIASPPPLPTPPPPLPQHAASAPTSVVQKPRGNGNKRPPEAVASGSGAAGASAAPPVKRKRGRPRKPRPEDALPPPPPATLSPKPPPQPPIITSLTGGVIQKASSSSSSQPVLELVIQDQPGLVLSQLPAVSDSGHRLMEHRGVVVQCQPAVEPDRHGRPLLLFQSAGGNPGWELAAAGRTPMVEVIQKAPRPSNNNSAPPPAAHLHPLPFPLPPPTMHEEQGEVEITLTPVELHVNPSSSSICSVALVKSEEEEAESSASSKTH